MCLEAAGLACTPQGTMSCSAKCLHVLMLSKTPAESFSAFLRSLTLRIHDRCSSKPAASVGAGQRDGAGAHSPWGPPWLGGAGGTQQGPRTRDVSSTTSPTVPNPSSHVEPAPRWSKPRISRSQTPSGAGPAAPPARPHAEGASPLLCWFWQRGGTRSRTTALARLSQSYS